MAARRTQSGAAANAAMMAAATATARTTDKHQTSSGGSRARNVPLRPPVREAPLCGRPPSSAQRGEAARSCAGGGLATSPGNSRRAEAAGSVRSVREDLSCKWRVLEGGCCVCWVGRWSRCSTRRCRSRCASCLRISRALDELLGDPGLLAPVERAGSARRRASGAAGRRSRSRVRAVDGDQAALLAGAMRRSFGRSRTRCTCGGSVGSR